ncbi:MAG: hypothetical protein J0H08_06480 [Rhizobiales bacterium]|nr:hypothetical protein [Hyphomicrobiales bacterium]
MMQLKDLGLGAALVIGLLAPQVSHAAGSFECPWQPIADKPAASVAKLLPSANALADDADITATITELRGQGLSSGLIVDSIISAYCPAVVAETGLTDAQKADALEAYAARVTDMVYSYSDADEIILDVTVPTGIAAEIRSTASDAGLSVDDWLAGVVEQAVGGGTP